MGDGSSTGLRAVLELHTRPETTAEEHEEAARRLRATLFELDLDTVAGAEPGEVPDGAKAADPVTLGAIVVALAASGGVLTTLIGTVNDWLTRQRSGNRISITIDGDTLELDSARSEERLRLITEFLARRSGTAAPTAPPAAEPAHRPAIDPADTRAEP